MRGCVKVNSDQGEDGCVNSVGEYRGILNSKILKDKMSFTVSNNNKNNNNIYNFKVENII